MEMKKGVFPDSLPGRKRCRGGGGTFHFPRRSLMA